MYDIIGCRAHSQTKFCVKWIIFKRVETFKCLFVCPDTSNSGYDEIQRRL